VWGGVQYPWGSPQIIGGYTLGALALAMFVRIERRAKDPVLPLQLWKSRIFATANIANMTLAMGMFGAIYFIPIFVQGVIGTSVTRSGAILTPMMLGLVITSALNGQLISRTGRYKTSIIAGVSLVGLGFILLSRMDRATSLSTVTFNMLLVGIGLGAAMQTFTLVVQNAVRREDMGTATAATQLFRSIGSTVGIAILGTLMTNGMAREIPRRVPPTAIAAVSRRGAPAGEHGTIGAGAVLDPEMLAQLPPAVREGIRDGLSAALHPVFLAGIPFIAIALLASVLIPEVPLRRTASADAGEAGREVLAELVHAGAEDTVPVLGSDNPLYTERTRLLASVFRLVATQRDVDEHGELTRVLARLGEGNAERGRHHLAVLASALGREGGDAAETGAVDQGIGTVPTDARKSYTPAAVLDRFLTIRPADLRDHLRAIVRREEGGTTPGLTPADLETLERVAMAAAAAALLDRPAS
jgi:MFS family permease